MFTQTRTNLKFIGVILFTMLFFVGGFFIKTTNAEAVDGAQSFNVSYSLSPVVYSTDSNGITTSTVRIGCAPESRDIYDINTGLRCVRITSNVLIGCAPKSGDLYDINTGKQCAYVAPDERIACAPQSGDIYDIHTGQRCTVDTSITKPTVSIVNTPTITQNPTITQKFAPIVASNITETSPEISPTDNTDNALSGREKLGDSLSAGVVKAGSILKGPMSIWLILLLIIIILGGSYGIYSLVSNKGKKPIIQHKPIAPVAPLTHSQINTPTPAPTTQTMPLNTPQSR